MIFRCVVRMSGLRELPVRGAYALTMEVLAIVVGMSCVIPVLVPPPTSAATGGSDSTSGYWLVASDGGIFAYGDAAFYGSPGSVALNKPVVGMAATPDGRGYWLVASDGGIFAYGDAAFYGSPGSVALNKPVVGMAATPDGRGYWLVASDGGIFAYGDAAFYGSPGSVALNKPVVGMAATPDGRGYWLVASDGGIFAYGDAAFYGSPGSVALNKPVVGMAATPDGRGYWLVASDGGIFAYGDAAFYGSPGSVALNKPVVGMAATPDGRGYWLVASDGGIFAYGDAAFYGSPGSVALNKPVVGMAAPFALAAGGSPSVVAAAPTTATVPTTTAVPSTTTTQPLDDPSGQPMPTTPPTGYQPLFVDDFTSSTLGSNWHEYSGDDFGVYNGQAGTTWDPSHVTVGNGLLTLRTYQDPTHAGPNSPWVEGGVALWPNSSLTYGEYLVRSRVTSATGVTQVMTLWTDNTWPPEIDWNESNGTNSSGATEWYNGTNGAMQIQAGPSGVDLTQWHTWGVITTPSTITYTVDGKVWATMPNNVTTPTHLTLQQMIWPCADPYETCPSSSTPPEVDMQIDWVAVYSPTS